MNAVIDASAGVFSRIESLLLEWIEREGYSRVDFEYSYIALAGSYICWMHTPEGSTRVHLPSDISLIVRDLRRSQVDPRRGAWLWSHFWMEATDGVLHQECDWMRDPVGDGDAAFELDQFPQDPQWVPEWMAVKAAAYHKEADRRERRRQRDRERRARKKAEVAGAVEVTGEQSGSDASGRVDE